MSTPTLQDQLRSYYLEKADEISVLEIEFTDFVRQGPALTVAGRQPAAPQRRYGVLAAACLVLVAGIAGAVLLNARSSAPATSASTAAATNTTALNPATTAAGSLPVFRPLALSTSPGGDVFTGLGVRPASGEATHGAVFVKRDGQGITERVTARLRAEIYRGNPGQGIPIPANLAPAVGSAVTAFTQSRTLRVEYGLGDRGDLIFDAYHDDPSSNAALSNAIQTIAAQLSVIPGHDITVTGALPDGWSLAATGTPPEELVPSYHQTIDLAAGGHRIIVENRFVDDPAFPFWMSCQTLVPVTVRGHAGYVTFDNDYGPDGTTVKPTKRRSMLIWEESPENWVTLLATDLTSAQAIALADELVPAPVTSWQADTSAAATTTTISPLVGS
jgi:hypothetical protein